MVTQRSPGWKESVASVRHTGDTVSLKTAGVASLMRAMSLVSCAESQSGWIKNWWEKREAGKAAKKEMVT